MKLAVVIVWLNITIFAPSHIKVKPDVKGVQPQIVTKIAKKEVVVPVRIQNRCNLSKESENVWYAFYEASSNCGTLKTLEHIVREESTFRPDVVNPISQASGLAQWIPSSWSLMCKGNVLDPVDNLKCSVRVIEAGGARDNWYLWW